MPLDLSGFVSKPNDFSGLYKISDDLRQNKQLAERKAERQQQEADRQDARKTATSSYLQYYLNPKHFLTGTNYDPVVTTGVSKILQKGMQLASKGVNAADITNALAPDVADLSKATEGIKALEKQRTGHEALLKNVKGIDTEKYNQEFKKAAYYNPDGSMKDLSTVDPSINYSDQVLKNSDVFNNEGVDDFVSKSGKNTTYENLKTIGSKGNMRQTKAEVTMPTFMQREEDPVTGIHKGFVPKYDTATDEDSHLLHTFKDDTGNEVKAPVRMVTDEVFSSLPPVVLSKIRQDVRSLIKGRPDISINSPQAEHLAKAIAYDELKNSGKQYSTLKETQVIKDTPVPKVGVNIYNNMQPPTVDLYAGKGGVKEIVESDQGKGYDYTRFNKLPAAAQTELLKIARDAAGDKSLDFSDIRIKGDGDGTINMVIGKKGYTIPIDPMSLNVPANAAIFKLDGTKGKAAALNKVNLGNSIQTQKTHKTKNGIELPVF